MESRFSCHPRRALPLTTVGLQESPRCFFGAVCGSEEGSVGTMSVLRIWVNTNCTSLNVRSTTPLQFARTLPRNGYSPTRDKKRTPASIATRACGTSVNHLPIAFAVVLKRPRSITSPCWLSVQKWLQTWPRSMPIASSIATLPGHFRDEVLRRFLDREQSAPPLEELVIPSLRTSAWIRNTALSHGTI